MGLSFSSSLDFFLKVMKSIERIFHKMARLDDRAVSPLILNVSSFSCLISEFYSLKLVCCSDIRNNRQVAYSCEY